jgi:hypothetical protein
VRPMLQCRAACAACSLLAVLWLARPTTPAIAQEPAKEAVTSPWQAYFRSLAGEYEMVAGEDRRELALVKEPVLKWSQPVRGGQDGAVFLWLDGGRPAAIGTFFIWPAGENRQGVSHELHRLAADRIAGDWRDRIKWRPAQDDVQWQVLAGAPAPHAEKTKRAAQARQFARRFAAASKTRDGQSSELRLQPRAFFEYEAERADSEWLGGALFSLAHGTDTEIVLWLEARRGRDAPLWHYALARMSDLQLAPRLDDKQLRLADFAGYDKFDSPHLCTSPEYFKDPPAVTK